MKIFNQAVFFLAVLASSINSSFSQISYEHHFAIGGFLADETKDIDYDQNDNILVVGFCQGLGTNNHAVSDTLSGTTTFTNYGARDGFVTKISSNGSISWAIGIGGGVTTTNEEALCVAADDTGNVYIGGFFSGSTISDGTNTANGSGQDNEAFLLKLDALGNSLWVKSFGFSGNQAINDIAILPNGNIAITGTIGDSISFGGNHLIGSGGVDLFLTSLNPSGNLVWQTQTTNGNNTNKASQIAVDNNGDIYLGGEVNGNGFSGTGSMFGGYLAKFSSLGNVIWDKSIAGGDNTIAAISIDGNGYLYASGEFQAPLAISSSISLSVAGTSDGFVAKYDTSGIFQNVIQLKSSGQDHVNGIFTPNAKDVFFTGSFEGFQVEFLDSSGALINDAFQIGGEDFYYAQTTDSFISPSVSVFGNGSTNADRTYAIAGNANQFSIGGSFNGTPFYMKNQSNGPSVPGQASTAFIGTYGFTPTITGPPGPTPIPKYTITFEVDMQNENVASGVNLSYLEKGNILKDTAMVNSINDIYSISLEVDSGFPIYYRFKNGSSFESVPFQCNTYDSLSNQTRLHLATMNNSIPLVCFASCGMCIPKPICNVGAAGTISGATNYCLGDQEIAFEVPPISGAIGYVWYLASGNQIIAGGQGTPKIKLNMNDIAGSVLAVYGTDGTCNGDTATLNLAAPSAPVTFSIVENIAPNCGEATGQIEASNISGGSTYDFQWTNGENTAILDSVAGGVYEVTITANTGCSASSAYSLASTGAPSLLATPTEPTCFGDNDGEIDLTISGGTLPYEVKWLTGQTTEDIQNLEAGGYYVEVKDDSGCVAFVCVQVTQPNPVLVGATLTDPSTCSAIDGAIAATASGGTGLLNFNWSTSATSQTISNLNAGIYNLTVSDIRGCISDTTFGLSDQGALSAEVINIFPTSCNNFSGSIEVATKNAVNPTFIWSNGDTTEDISNLASGFYSLQIEDSNCLVTATGNIFEMAPQPIEVCMVTVDDTTKNNLLVFDKTTADSLTSNFNIYRESCLTNQFLKVGSVNIADQSEFEDLNSNPSVKSWKYKITSVDACGNESFASPFHKTIHTTVQGDTINGTNISWNPYIGFNYNWFYIERFNSQSGWVILDSVATNQLNYFDANPVGATADIKYSVFIKHPFGCTSFEANKNYNSARSNRSAPPFDTSKVTTPIDTTDTTISVINLNALNNQILLYPNPANDLIFVQLLESTPSNFNIEILDLNGRVLKQISISTENSKSLFSFNLENISNGIYILKYGNKGFVARKQFVISR